MQYRIMGKTGERVSALGFGCMRIPGVQTDGKWQYDEDAAVKMFRRAIEAGVNYFDTAYMYSDSQNERIVGKALSGGYRERVLLTTKLPVWCCQGPEDFQRIFGEQLTRLGTDHLDFYLLHSLNRETFEKARDWGVFDFLEGLKREGKIRHIGFSFHGSYEEFEFILRAYPWEVCQIQFNYLDVEQQAGEKGLRLAGELGVPVIIMEGLRGGRLANVPDTVQALFDLYPVRRSPACWAFRFLADYPEVVTVLSGMSTEEQLADNLQIFADAEIGCMTPEERNLMADARAAFEARTKVGCTGCRYCMPCPSGVDIPGIFALWNQSAMFGTASDGAGAYLRKREKGADASRCVVCRACEAACPQKLPIPELLKKADAELSAAQ